jgi:CheY-like chemotaxis protein
MPKVMIIDDNRMMVTLLKTLFELDGFEVVGVDPHGTVIERVQAERPDLVLMDVFLPGSDGIQELSRLRSLPDLAGLRVIMTSGMDMTEKCMANGADGFLAKPFTPEQLMSIVRASLARPPAGTPGGEG